MEKKGYFKGKKDIKEADLLEITKKDNNCQKIFKK